MRSISASGCTARRRSDSLKTWRSERPRYRTISSCVNSCGTCRHCVYLGSVFNACSAASSCWSIRNLGRPQIEYPTQFSLPLVPPSRKVGAADHSTGLILRYKERELRMKHTARAGVGLTAADARSFAGDRVSVANNEHGRNRTFAEVGQDCFFKPPSIERVG